MKSTFASIAGFLLFAGAMQLSAQDQFCESGYMPFQRGVYYEMTNYDKKGKVTGLSKNTVSEVENLPDGFKAHIATTLCDKKGKELTASSTAFECRNNTVYLDMNMLLDPSTKESMISMDLEFSGDNLHLPSNLKPGMTLPNAEMEVKAKTGGMTIMTIRHRVFDRKVDAVETITTPAGAFECAKLSESSEINMLFRREYRVVSWYAKGVGLVRSETYDSKGRLEASSEMTVFVKG